MTLKVPTAYEASVTLSYVESLDDAACESIAQSDANPLLSPSVWRLKFCMELSPFQESESANYYSNDIGNDPSACLCHRGDAVKVECSFLVIRFGIFTMKSFGSLSKH